MSTAQVRTQWLAIHELVQTLLTGIHEYDEILHQEQQSGEFAASEHQWLNPFEAELKKVDRILKFRTR